MVSSSLALRMTGTLQCLAQGRETGETSVRRYRRFRR